MAHDDMYKYMYSDVVQREGCMTLQWNSNLNITITVNMTRTMIEAGDADKMTEA